MMHFVADHGRHRRTHRQLLQQVETRGENSRRPTPAAHCTFSPPGGLPFVAARVLGVAKPSNAFASKIPQTYVNLICENQKGPDLPADGRDRFRPSEHPTANGGKLP